jgi:hypothetical protein
MEYNNSDIKYSKNLINDILVSILGVPKKYQGGRSFGGYWSLMNKWLYKDKYDLQYIYFVVSRLENSTLKMNTGFVEGALRSKNWIESYNPEEHKLPAGGERDRLLNAGHTIKTLPAHLLTKDERKKRKEETIEAIDGVTDAQREALAGLLTQAGGVFGSKK